MNFSFWKLLRRQWSWKNDKSLFISHTVTSCVITLIYHITGSISVQPLDFYWYGGLILFLGFLVIGLVLYHTSKLVLFSICCWLVSSEANKGNPEAISIYNEMVQWRQ